MNTAHHVNGQAKFQPFKDERGQVLVMTVLCCTVLLGFMALALDVGMLFRAKRNLQIAADSAALAATLDYLYNHNPNDTTVNATNVSSANAVGVAAAALDGFSSTAAVNPSTVTVAPAWDGVYAGTPGYFEATIVQPNPTMFMGIFNHGWVSIAVRAVAGTPYHSTGCFYTENKKGTLGKGSSTVYFQGSFELNSPKCGIEINGTDPNTLYFNNNTKAPDGLFAASVGVVGGCGGFCSDSNVPIVTGIAPVTSPFQGIVAPAPASFVPSCSVPTGGTTKIKGTSYNILQANAPAGCYIGPIALQNNLLAGTYEFTGEVLVNSNVAADSGTTMVLWDGSFSQATNTTFSITAPTSGLYKTIALLAPTSNTGTFQLELGNTGGKSNLNGIVDMPGMNFTLHDSGGGAGACDTITADFVIGTFNDQTGCLSVTSYSQTHDSPLKAVALVE